MRAIYKKSDFRDGTKKSIPKVAATTVLTHCISTAISISMCYVIPIPPSPVKRMIKSKNTASR